jgi:Holliday junction resolvase RusA-like endonuclease
LNEATNQPLEAWVPLTFNEMPTDVQQLIVAPFPISSVLREWVVGEFEKQCDLQFSPHSWSADDAALFRKWWWFQLENGDFTHRRWPHLETLLYNSLSSKASSLAQRPCHVCSGMLPTECQFPGSFLPIRIAPESRQSLNQIDWTAFQDAMKHWFNKRHLNLGPSDHLCIAITYVLSKRRPDRDLDNMTKALMDAFSRAVGFNDKNIHHLDVVKLRDDVDEEHVFIRIRPSYVQDSSSVLILKYDAEWAVGDALCLQDFKR